MTCSMNEPMKHLLTITTACVLLCLTTPPVFAEGAGIEWGILTDEVMELYRAGKYDRGVVVAKKALEVAEQNVGPDHPDVATSLNNLAMLYQAQGHYAKAEPLFKKSLAIDHARDGEVMLAFAMNGEALPLLNGFPLRLIVPGWFSTYWVKMLSDIEVLDHADENFWMAKAYKLPDNRWADVTPGQTGYSTVPISTMVPRAWITNLSEGASVRLADVVPIRGIAMGGTRGVAKVDISPDGGRHWYPTELSPDEGRYSFRRWQISAKLPHGGKVPLTVRCTNSAGETQPMAQNWNPGGYRRAGAETITINAA